MNTISIACSSAAAFSTGFIIATFLRPAPAPNAAPPAQIAATQALSSPDAGAVSRQPAQTRQQAILNLQSASPNDYRHIARELARAWGRHNHPEALEHALTLSEPERSSFALDAVLGWAETDVDAAWNWILNPPAGFSVTPSGQFPQIAGDLVAASQYRLSNAFQSMTATDATMIGAGKYLNMVNTAGISEVLTGILADRDADVILPLFLRSYNRQTSQAGAVSALASELQNAIGDTVMLKEALTAACLQNVSQPRFAEMQAWLDRPESAELRDFGLQTMALACKGSDLGKSAALITAMQNVEQRNSAASLLLLSSGHAMPPEISAALLGAITWSPSDVRRGYVMAAMATPRPNR